MNEPLVSVVLSSYNRPTLIRDALDSILAQTWPNIEVIVADDWSDHAVHDVLAEYGSCFTEGRSLLCVQPGPPPTPEERQHGQRCAICINTAMACVHGDFVVYLPDDDFLTLGSIEVRVRYLIEHPEVNVVYGRLESCKSPMPAMGLHSLPEGIDCGEFGVRPSLPSFLQGAGKCKHDRNSFYSAEPVARIANRCDHGMPMVRRVPNMLEHTGPDGFIYGGLAGLPMSIPQWPETRTREIFRYEEHGRIRQLEEIDDAPFSESWLPGERFDCPDAGWFYRLELAGLGPFHSVPDVVVVKRYGHPYGHRSDPSRRE
jgi:hypothetical protein